MSQRRRESPREPATHSEAEKNPVEWTGFLDNCTKGGFARASPIPDPPGNRCRRSISDPRPSPDRGRASLHRQKLGPRQAPDAEGPSQAHHRVTAALAPAVVRQHLDRAGREAGMVPQVLQKADYLLLRCGDPPSRNDSSPRPAHRRTRPWAYAAASVADARTEFAGAGCLGCTSPVSYATVTS